MPELEFVAPDSIRNNLFTDDDAFYDEFVIEDENGLHIESFRIDSHENLVNLLQFLFGTNIELHLLLSTASIEVIDLTAYKLQCITINDLENQYQNWLQISGRENNMDEYGSLLGIIGFIERNTRKQHLLLRVRTFTE